MQPLRVDLGRPCIRSRSSGSVSTSTQKLNQAAAIATQHSKSAGHQSKNDNGFDSRD
jgi:hypothetical protein